MMESVIWAAISIFLIGGILGFLIGSEVQGELNKKRR